MMNCFNYLGGNDSGFSGLSSHSLALQFLSNNLAPPPPPTHPLITSPQLMQHINGNGHYNPTNITNPLLYAIAGKPFSHSSSGQASSESPQSPTQTSNVKQAASPSILHTKVSPKLEVKSSSSPTSRRSPTMMTSNEGGNSNMTSHLTQAPYGLSHQFDTCAIKLYIIT